jgi:hypothetical protein
MKLLSLPQITALFPKNAKPAEKKIRGLVKSSRYCIKIGRKLYIRSEDVDSFLASLCSASTETPRVRTGMSGVLLRDDEYAKVRERLIAEKQKRSGDKRTPNYTIVSPLDMKALQRGAKR